MNAKPIEDLQFLVPEGIHLCARWVSKAEYHEPSALIALPDAAKLRMTTHWLEILALGPDVDVARHHVGDCVFVKDWVSCGDFAGIKLGFIRQDMILGTYRLPQELRAKGRPDPDKATGRGVPAGL